MANFEWHPMMVHFPLALTIIGALCLFGTRLSLPQSMRDSLAAAGSWNLIIAAVTVYITLGTGLLAVHALHLTGGALYSVSRHVVFAVCGSQVISLLALWRAFGGRFSAVPGWIFLSLLTVACAAFIVTGYYGGENVYHYGLGVHGSTAVQSPELLK